MNKNYYGIDLGTTNSAISYFDGHETRIIKNREQSDVTPSVVNINKSGGIKVGTKAKNAMVAHPEDAICEFKRWMGTSNKVLFESSGVEMDAEQLSAEVLKSLLGDVYQNTSENIKNAVITVPIEFGQLQCEATIRAGNMAGLKNIYLLQEPIAASIAYGYKENRSNKIWLVYDFGGGTFDAALISTYNNKLTVVGHAGDNLLGGKDLDNEIIDSIILPKVRESYSIENLDMPSLRRRICEKVEEAKIELTYCNKTEISISDIGEDDYDNEIELCIELTRDVFDSLIKSYIQKTITICNNVLNESRVSKNRLDCIILVGGTTYIPLVRDMLSNEFDVLLKNSIDPMTVVSVGASIYSYTVENSKEQIINNEISKEYKDNQISVKLAYDATSAETEALVRGKIENGNKFGTIEVNVENNNGLWNSGWYEANNYKFEIPVLLQEKRKTEFNIYYRDEKGQLLNGNIKSFAITHIGLEFDNPPLPHSIGIEVYDEKKDKNIYEIIFDKKNTKLPCEKDVIYKANRTLKPSDYGEAIEFTIWEGENEVASLNDFAGKMKITANMISECNPVLENDKIELHFEINESRRIYVQAYIEKIDKYFSLNIYIPERKTIDEEIKDNLDSLSEDYKKIEDNPDFELLNTNPNYIEEIQEKIDDIYVEINSEASQNDINSKQKVNRNIKELRIGLNNMFKYKENSKVNSLIEEVKESQRKVNSIVSEDGNDNDKQSMELLNIKVEGNIKNGNERFLRKTNDDLWKLGFNILFRKFDYWEYWFNNCKAVSLNKVYDKNRFNELILIGDKAIAANDIEALRCVVTELMDLVENDDINNDKLYIRPGLKK